MKKRILLATDNAHDATSFLRAWGAFTENSLSKQVERIRRPEGHRWCQDWTYFFDVDCVYLHRPSTSVDFMVIERAKQLGIPLWVDFDDDLEMITPDNPVYSSYSKTEIKEVIKHAYREADILSVGGKRMARRLRKEYQREVHLIPNALDDRLIFLKKPFNYSNKISWRGSQSHLIDLTYFKEIFEYLVEKKPDLEWCFFQSYPAPLENIFQKADMKFGWLPEMNLFDFYIAFTHYNASRHLIPLKDTEFNRVKSNLAWSDATLAGAIPFCPDFDEYEEIPCFKYHTETWRQDLINYFSLDEKQLKKLHDESWQYLRENLLMSQINQKRIEILKNL